MNLRELIAIGALALLLTLLLAREIARRVGVHYEYRWDSFAIRGLFGRQLFQIRQSEIESLTAVGLGQRVTGRVGVRFWPRTHFGPRVLIRARMTRRPVVISWEGEAIAGLVPEGLKLRSPNDPKRR
jgi:hypothetical protein